MITNVVQISARAHLALELVIRLAADAEPWTSERLAKTIGRSVLYTDQLLARLRDAGLLERRFGRPGQHLLGRPANEITVADVLEVFDNAHLADPTNAIPVRSSADAEILESTELLWKSLEDHIVQVLSDLSVADIANANGSLESSYRERRG